jgi:hypothetical protein
MIPKEDMKSGFPATWRKMLLSAFEERRNNIFPTH